MGDGPEAGDPGDVHSVLQVCRQLVRSAKVHVALQGRRSSLRASVDLFP